MAGAGKAVMTIRVDWADRDRFNALAWRLRMSQNALASDLLRSFLHTHEHLAAALDDDAPGGADGQPGPGDGLQTPDPLDSPDLALDLHPDDAAQYAAIRRTPPTGADRPG